jgi:DNA (cytosine-5)-methyltransferase 1
MPKLLDLFCGAGGASVGYFRAGFEVTGLDIKYGKRYPHTYKRMSIQDVTVDMLMEYDVIHASPPCQTFSVTRNLRIAQGKSTDKVDWLDFTRELLVASGKPYVIENVMGAPLRDPVLLCGSAFNLKVRRHRLFESNMPLVGTECNHKNQGRPVGIYGSMRDEIPGGGRTAHTMQEANEAMGIDWMIWGELVEAIPPTYTEYIGKQLIKMV